MIQRLVGWSLVVLKPLRLKNEKDTVPVPGGRDGKERGQGPPKGETGVARPRGGKTKNDYTYDDYVAHATTSYDGWVGGL